VEFGRVLLGEKRREEQRRGEMDDAGMSENLFLQGSIG
jgi:hypothetical protein